MLSGFFFCSHGQSFHLKGALFTMETMFKSKIIVINMNYEFLTVYRSEFKGNQLHIRHCLVGILTLIIIDL